MRSRPRHPALDTLADAILEIPAPFACGGTLLPPRPLQLHLAGGLELPIERGEDLDNQSKRIAPLLARARPAPFGKGQRTLRDRAVRDAVQLQAAGGAVELEGFDPAAEGVLESIRSTLAPLDPSPLTAELYDINVYGPKGHFVDHKDTPRGSDMLGTLVVCLPARFTGGALIVEHRGAEMTFDWGTAVNTQAEAHRVHWAAFFGDVNHRVEEVQSGHRITASYVLRRGAGAQKAVTKSRAEALVAAFSEALADRWFMVEGGVLALPCMHLYGHDLREAPSSTPLDRATAARLKGVDAEMATAALDAGLIVRLTPFLAETCANDTWRLKRFPTPKETRLLSGRVIEYELAHDLPVESRVPHAWDRTDEPGPITEWVLPAPSGPEHQNDGEPETDPASQHLSYAEYSATGYFGNEGSHTEFYLYAALEAQVPPAVQRKLDQSKGPARERADRAAIAAIVAAGPEAALKVLQRLTAEHAADDARALAGALVDGWSDKNAWYLARSERPIRAVMLEVLAGLDDAPLLARFIERVIVVSYDGQENAELAGALVQLDPKHASPLCPALFAAKALMHPTACAALLGRVTEGLCGTAPEHKAMALEAAAGLLLALSDNRGGAASDAGAVAPAFLATLFSSLEAIGDRALQQRAVTEVAEKPGRYPGDVIAQALAELAPRHPTAGWLPDLWRIGVERLLARSEAAIPPPPDWVEERMLRCACRDCARASELLRSPVERTGRFPMAEARRHHVEQELRGSGCDVETVTERRGNPYALVITKTRKRHQRRLDLQALDLAALGWLGALELPSVSSELRARARNAGLRPEAAGTAWPPGGSSARKLSA